jgi:hypothetical protein
MSGLVAAAVGAVLMAVVSTVGDFVWATWIPSHEVVYGLIHGTVLFLCLGTYLGALAGRAFAGAAGGAVVGLGAAGGFYVLAPLAGMASMFVLWFMLWIGLAILNSRLARRTHTWTESLLRGLAAAVFSAAAFYAISGIWLSPAPGGPDYPRHLVSWAFAFLPGFAALLVRRS